jgi:hypothetical protein
MIEKRKKVVIQSLSACPIWPTEAAEKIGQMLGEINQANTIMARNGATAWHNAVKGGYAAETFHAESFNLDAILKDKDVRAFTDQSANTPLGPRDPLHDIVVIKDGEQALGVQLKYYKDADATQKALRATDDGVHQYEKCDVFVSPSDQIDGIAASAEKTALKNQETRPDVSRAAEKVRDSTPAILRSTVCSRLNLASMNRNS